MRPDIQPLDPADVSTVDAVQALRVAAEAVDIPDFPAPCPYDFWADLTRSTSSKRHERFVARLGDQVVGYLSLCLPLKEDLDNVEVGLTVHPAWRRRGVGRALHEHLLRRMREVGRKRYLSYTVTSLPDGPGRGDAGTAFAAVMGAQSALDEVRSRLDLETVNESELDTMVTAATGQATGYRVVSWSGDTPDEYVADVGYLSGRLISDAPMGELTLETPQIDAARLQESEAMVAAGRWRLYSAGAVHESTGRLVALTQLARQESSPWHAFQWITLVAPEHRGHRLGVLVKVANLRQARAHESELRVVDTWNAEVNRHMLGINVAMGFRPVDRWLNWQREIASIREEGAGVS